MRGWFASLLILGACRGPNGVALGELPQEASAGEPAVAASPAAQDTGGATSRVGSAGDSTPPETSASGGAFPAPDGCGAEPVTLDEVHSGRVRAGVRVSVTGLVASSQKFLVSEAKSGSCLWGAFAAAAQGSGAGSGLFLVSFGAPHADGAACAPGADGLPDDLAPGDALEAEGTLDAYAPAGCNGTAPAQQLRIDATCPARRGAHGAVPEPARIDLALAARLGAGKDQQLLRDWGGALVRLEAVSAQQDGDDGDAVFPFGVIRLDQAPLEVHSRLYYFDLSEGGPRASSKAPRYAYPTAFDSITGVVFLDYCTWVLAPRDRCADLEPGSAGCALQARRP